MRPSTAKTRPSPPIQGAPLRSLIATPLACLVALLLLASSAAAQSELAAGVRAFVTVSDPVVALTHVNLIDGTGAPARADQTILIEGGRITAVGAAGALRVPTEARVLDLTGRTVAPGLVMLHEHMFYPSGAGAYNQQQFSFPRLYLASGTTTIRTGGSRDPYGDLNLAAAIARGEVPGPRMHVTGPYVNGPGLPLLFVHASNSPAEARALVSYWADQGAGSFKAYMQISRASLSAAIAEAHTRGLKVTGHLCAVTYAEAADLGIDNLEHGLMAATDFIPGKQPDECPAGGARQRSLATLDVEGPEARALIAHLVEKGVALTSTLPVFEISTPGRPPAPAGALDAMSPDARDRYLRTWANVQSQGSSLMSEIFPRAMAFEVAFLEAGGLLVAGTDPTGYGGVVAGYANHREVQLLVEAGLSIETAIQVASLNGARHLGIDGEVGSVEVGKLADLMIMEGDPATDLAALERTELVFKGGVGYDARALFASVRGTVGIR